MIITKLLRQDCYLPVGPKHLEDFTLDITLGFPPAAEAIFAVEKERIEM
jgi:hypothetical protein